MAQMWPTDVIFVARCSKNSPNIIILFDSDHLAFLRLIVNAGVFLGPFFLVGLLCFLSLIFRLSLLPLWGVRINYAQARSKKNVR